MDSTPQPGPRTAPVSRTPTRPKENGTGVHGNGNDNCAARAVKPAMPTASASFHAHASPSTFCWRCRRDQTSGTAHRHGVELRRRDGEDHAAEVEEAHADGAGGARHGGGAPC